MSQTKTNDHLLNVSKGLYIFQKLEDLLRQKEKEKGDIQKQYDDRMVVYNKAKMAIQDLTSRLCGQKEKVSIVIDLKI